VPRQIIEYFPATLFNCENSCQSFSFFIFKFGFIFGYESILGIQIIFILTALLFFGFSLITFHYLNEIKTTKFQTKHFKEAFKRVVYTIKNLKKFRSLWIFLLASFLYVDAASTAIIFLFLFARDQLGFSLQQFLPVYFLLAISAGAGALISGRITDRFGHKRTLTTVLFLWVAVILLLYIRTNFTTFIIVGVFGGALLGSIWTITRALLVQIAPGDKVAELFGYQGLTEKFGGVFGPVLFGAVATFVGFRQALLVVIGLFLLGAFALSFVKIRDK